METKAFLFREPITKTDLVDFVKSLDGSWQVFERFEQGSLSRNEGEYALLTMHKNLKQELEDDAPEDVVDDGVLLEFGSNSFDFSNEVEEKIKSRWTAEVIRI